MIEENIFPEGVNYRPNFKHYLISLAWYLKKLLLKGNLPGEKASPILDSLQTF